MALLNNLRLIHSYLPSHVVMKTCMVPIVENKTGDLSDSSNYRPISLATTVVTKVWKSLVNTVLSQNIHLHDAQFGFRPGLSIDMAIFGLKNTVQH